MAAGDQDKLSFLFYFQQTYITTPQHNATFDQSLWNVHNATVLGMDRTNNKLEGCNNKLSTLGGRRKPTIFKAIDIVQVISLNVPLKKYLNYLDAAGSYRGRRRVAMPNQRDIRSKAISGEVHQAAETAQQGLHRVRPWQIGHAHFPAKDCQ